MKKLLLLLAALALALAPLDQASAAYTVPDPITDWYFGTVGTLTNANTTSPEVTAGDINGMLYGVFPDVTLEVGDTIAYTFLFDAKGTTGRINDLRWGLFNNAGDYGTNFLGNNKNNWRGFWVDENSLQSANTAGNPFNFGGTAAVQTPDSFTKRNTIDPEGTFIYFVQIERTTATNYTLTARLFNTGIDGDTPLSYCHGVMAAPPDDTSTTNVLNTFGIYISSRPNFTSIKAIPPILPVDTVRVEAAADGSANQPVQAQTILSGQSITNFAIARDGSGTFLENTYGAWGLMGGVGIREAAWGLTNVTGDIQPSDLIVQKGLRSAVFTGHASGTAQIVCFGNGTNLVTSQTITVNGTVPTPTFNPPAGAYIGEQAVTINDGLSGATIYYTTNGSDPTTSSPIYTDPIVVPTDSNVTIKAFAAKAGNADSAIVSATYVTLTTPTWTSLASGSWTDAGNWYQGFVPNGANEPADFSTLTLGSDLTVTLDGNKKVGTAIFGDVGDTYNWTVDVGTGGTLELGDTTGANGITVKNGTATVNAVIVGNNGMLKDGAGTLLLNAANTYTGDTVVSNGTLQIGSFGSLDDPVTVEGGVLNGSGLLNGPVTVTGGTLSAGTAAGMGTLYVVNTVSLSAGGKVNMRISKTGGFVSSDSLVVNSITYGGALIVTNVTSDGSPLAAGDSFTLFSASPYGGAFNSYELPTLPSGLSWDLSQLQTAGSIAVITGVAPPIFNPPAGGYVGTPTVTISCGTPGATLYYTTNGTAPTVGSPSGSSPIAIKLPANSSSMMIQAYAAASGLPDSAVVSAIYSTVATPTWTSPFSGSWSTAGNWSNSVPANAANVTADFSTLNLIYGDVYVTLDGAWTVGNLKFGDVGNTYGWTIDAGTGGPLTLAGTNTPVITVNNGTNNIISAVIAGSDGMVKTGPGTLTLMAANTYTGGTTVDDGALALADGGGALSPNGSLTINNGATVEVDVANGLVGANPPNGSLPVTVNAGGTLTSLNTTIIPVPGLLTLNGGTLAGDGFNNTWGTWQLYGGVAVNGGTNVSTINCTCITVSQPGGTIFDVANGGTPSGVDLLVINQLYHTLNVNDTGVIKNGAGTMKLTGPNTYTGPTIINNGRFLVDGSLSLFTPVTVNNTATLGGTGTVGGVTFNAGSFAELTLGSPLTLADSLTVATIGTLPVVKVNLTNDVAPGTYPLATYSVTNSSGAFDSTPMILSGSVAAGNAGTIITDNGVVSLVVAPSGNTSPPGFPANAIQVAGGTVSLTATGAIGSTYKLWTTTNLALTPVTSTWTLLTNGTITVSPFTITDPGAVTNQQRFYLFSTP